MEMPDVTYRVNQRWLWPEWDVAVFVRPLKGLL